MLRLMFVIGHFQALDHNNSSHAVVDIAPWKLCMKCLSNSGEAVELITHN